MFNRFIPFFALAIALIPLSAIHAQEATPEMMPDQPLLAIPENATAIAFTPDGRYAYAIVDNAINGYGVGAEGTATLIDGSPFEVSGISYQPSDLVVSADGTTLYIANDGFVGRSLLIPITLWRIDAQTGALSPAATPRVTVVSNGTPLSGIGITGAGQVYVVNPGLGMVQPIIVPETVVSSTRTLTVAAFKRECVGMIPMLCHVVTDQDGNTGLFYQGIEGFDYQWGTEYILTARVETVANPPADGSSLRYTLEHIDRETRVAQFTEVYPTAFIREADGEFTLGETAFVCDESVDCTAFRAALAVDARLQPLGARKPPCLSRGMKALKG